MTPAELEAVRPLIAEALREDIGSGDITSEALVEADQRARAEFVTREDVVVCGLLVAREAVRMIDSSLSFDPLTEDGAPLDAGGVMARVEGSARSILAAERISLNFLQRLTGIATTARAYASRIEGTRTRALDTRKTVPGYRFLDKYAVRCGGVLNHRRGLFDGVLIKDNHLVFCPGPAQAVERARRFVGPDTPIEVEVQSIDELRQVIESSADRILIDNFDPESARLAVEIAGGRIPLEASGGITLDTVRAFAEAGVDYVSIGALTHSVRAADIHLALTPCRIRESA